MGSRLATTAAVSRTCKKPDIPSLINYQTKFDTTCIQCAMLCEYGWRGIGLIAPAAFRPAVKLETIKTKGVPWNTYFQSQFL